MRSLQALIVSCAAALPAQTFQLDTQNPGAQSLFGRTAVGDITGDGYADLVTFGWMNAQYFPGTASGLFGAPVPLPAPWLGNTVRLVDSNGDGQLDIWFSDQNGTARIESGGGGAAVTAFFGLARSFACADFDSDGHLDLVLGREAGPTFLRGDGAGGYAPEVSLGGEPWMAYVRCDPLDFDGDGHMDFVIQRFIGTTDLWRGLGNGSFQPLGALPFGPGYRLCEVADIDLDGDPDLIAEHTDFPVALHWNLGSGVFSPAQLLPFAAKDVAVADFDGDGVCDLVATQATQMLLALGIGGGQFAAALSFPTSAGYDVMVADIDGDGRTEAITNDGNQTISILRDISPMPFGLTAFGPGTPACGGTIGLGGTTAPAVGATDFRITSSNVPPDSIGVLAIGGAISYVDTAFDIRVHVLDAAPLAQMRSDRGGTASVAVPIPDLPLLAGSTVTLQAFWLADPRIGNTCSPALYDLASSRGLSVTFQ